MMGPLNVVRALPFLCLASAANIPSQQTASHEIRATAADDTVYDAIIVGGGPGGLSALSGLARVKRNVLLLDSGEYSSDAAREMHDVLDSDGVTPAYYRYAARQELSYYSTTHMMNATALRIYPNVQPYYIKDYSYIVQTQNTKKSTSIGDDCTFSARKIILATGLRYILPSTPGIAENWGKGILWDPWSNGYEHAGQSLGILSNLTNVPSLVSEILTLNSDIIAFVNGTDTPENRAATEALFPQWEAYLKLHNVTVENRTLASITRLRDGGQNNTVTNLSTAPEYDLFRVNFVGCGDSIERAVFLSNFSAVEESTVGEALGVRLDGGRLAADPSQGFLTNLPGVYAIGDANADNVTNVPHALYTGKQSAVHLHIQLALDDANNELTGNGSSTAAVELDPRAVWDMMNGKPGDLLYAGKFE
ncbi:sulphydryl oxidase [Biscogniauxia marginata]|nr:sulphydryl oxidase [Biscogniauxia marginata]